MDTTLALCATSVQSSSMFEASTDPLDTLGSGTTRLLARALTLKQGGGGPRLESFSPETCCCSSRANITKKQQSFPQGWPVIKSPTVAFHVKFSNSEVQISRGPPRLVERQPHSDRASRRLAAVVDRDVLAWWHSSRTMRDSHLTVVEHPCRTLAVTAMEQVAHPMPYGHDRLRGVWTVGPVIWVQNPAREDVRRAL